MFDIRSDFNGDGQGGVSDEVAAGVAITVEFNGQTYSGTTDSNGIFRTSWLRLSSGHDYYANAVDLALTSYAWDPFDVFAEEDDSDDNGKLDHVLHL